MKKIKNRPKEKTIALAEKLLAKADKEREKFVKRLFEKYDLLSGDELEDTIIMDRLVTEEETEYSNSSHSGSHLVSKFRIAGIVVGQTVLNRIIFPTPKITFNSMFLDSKFESINMERDQFIKGMVSIYRDSYKQEKEFRNHIIKLERKFRIEGVDNGKKAGDIS